MPFCYIGERKLALALEKIGVTADVEIDFHSFELDPNAKKSYGENINGAQSVDTFVAVIEGQNK